MARIEYILVVDYPEIEDASEAATIAQEAISRAFRRGLFNDGEIAPDWYGQIINNSGSKLTG